MLKSIGDTIWGIGQFAYTTGELVAKTVANTATCGAYNEAQQDLAAAGEQVKHDAEILVSENETLQELNKDLETQVQELKAGDNNSSEVSDKQVDEILDLQMQIENMEEANNELSQKTGELNNQISSLTKDVAAAELCAEQEADNAKSLEEKVKTLQAGIEAAKKGKK